MVSFFFFAWAEDNELLKIDASVSPKNLLRGKEGKILLKLSVKDGIIISSQPFFTIDLAPSEELVLSNSSFSEYDFETEILEGSGKRYLNLEKPIEIPFSVRLRAVRGSHYLEGKIKYFACSKEEAWCLKSNVKFKVPYFIQR